MEGNIILIVSTFKSLISLISQIIFFLLLISLISKIISTIRFIRKFTLLPQDKCHFIFGHIHRFFFHSSTPLPSDSQLTSSETVKTPIKDVTEYFISRRSHAKSGIGVLWLSWFPVVFCLDYKSAQAILSSRVHLNKAPLYKFVTPFLKDGLITSSGEKWRCRRRLIGPAFNKAVLDNFIPLITANASILVDKFKANKNGSVNLVEYIHLISIDIICQTVMGVSPKAQCEPRSSVVQDVTWMTRGFSHRIYNPLLWADAIFYLTFLGKCFLAHLTNFDHFTNSIIKNRIVDHSKFHSIKSVFDSNNNQIESKSKSFLNLLLEKHFELDQDTGQPIIDMNGVKEEINTFLFAGHDTTGTALMWTLYLLGLHSEIQEKVYNEITTVVGDDLGNLTMDQIDRLNYLEQCIKEGLRLFPPVPLIGRQLDTDAIIDSYTIPAGSTVALMIYTIHRDQKIYPKPNTFDPDRFNPIRSQSIPAYAFIPFSAGPRVCLGQRFAFLEMKIIISWIISHFTLISLKPLNEIPYEFEVTIRPKAPLNLKLIPRKKQSNCF